MEKNIKSLGSEYFQILETKEKLNNKIKELNNQLKEFEKIILNRMDDEGITSVKIDEGTLSMVVDIYTNIKDKELFFQWIKDTGNTHFMSLQCNRAAYKEALKLGEPLPDGVMSYKDRKLRKRRSIK